MLQAARFAYAVLGMESSTMEELRQVADAVLENDLAFHVSVAILGWLLLALLFVLFQPLSRIGPFARFAAITPTSLASIGVLGTFAGILLGLLNFDVERIDESVPELLSGLKFAFTTSLVGLSAAIFFRLARALAPTNQRSEGATPDAILSALIDLRDENRSLNSNSSEQLGILASLQAVNIEVRDNNRSSAINSSQHFADLQKIHAEVRDDNREAASSSSQQLAALRNAISADTDSSLLTQVQKLRTTIQDGQKDLITEFREFSSHMVENNQKAIIEALEAVLRDFNKNLTEQFGENFKQLNEAVHSLVTWQDNYREHVNALEKRLADAVSSVEASQRALESVQGHSERIPEAIRPLEAVLLGMNAQTAAMGEQLSSIAALRDKAIEAFPVIEKNLEKITTQFATGVEGAVAQSREALENGEKAHAELRNGFEAFLSDANSSRDKFSAELSGTLEKMSEQSTKEFERHGKLIEDAANEAQRTAAESREKMNEHFEAFDRQMQEELTRALKVLGSNLACISEKFTND